MHDLFLPFDDISTAEVLELIINYQFLEPIYHSDGFGHVQVEEPLQSTPYNISNLIHFIEKKQQWSALLKLLPSKNECWLLSFSLELQKEESKGVLSCLITLTDFIKTQDNKIAHLQHAAQWPWISGTILLVNVVLSTLAKIEQDLLKEDGQSAEIDLTIVRQTLIELAYIKKNIEAEKC